MFEVVQRERVLARLIELAEADPRIATAAIVGSLADGSADGWSDIDLAMCVDESAAVGELLAAWSDTMADEFDAVMACAARGIRSGYGRGIDDLPRTVIDGFEDALVRSLEREELLRALDSTLALLIRRAVDLEGERLARLVVDLPTLAAVDSHG